MAFVRSASNSERLVHWNKNPRSRIVWRKGDCKLASAASSRASSSIMVVDDDDDDVSVDASTVENRRKLFCLFAERGTAVDVLVTDAVVITAARLRVAVSVEREKADAVVAIMAEVR